VVGLAAEEVEGVADWVALGREERETVEESVGLVEARG